METFFKKASELFLTEGLTHQEYIDLVDSGGRLPVTENYEYWDEMQLEDAIIDFSEALEREAGYAN